MLIEIFCNSVSDHGLARKLKVSEREWSKYIICEIHFKREIMSKESCKFMVCFAAAPSLLINDDCVSHQTCNFNVYRIRGTLKGAQYYSVKIAFTWHCLFEDIERLQLFNLSIYFSRISKTFVFMWFKIWQKKQFCLFIFSAIIICLLFMPRLNSDNSNLFLLWTSVLIFFYVSFFIAEQNVFIDRINADVRGICFFVFYE